MSPSIATSAPSANSPPDRGGVLAVILVSYVLIVLNISTVITGLPQIRDDLGFSDTDLSWVTNAYTLTFGGLLLLGARAGDILGHRRMLTIGLGVFALSSLVIGLAPSAGWLIGARGVQGMGSALLAPPTLALLQTTFPMGPERTRAVSFYAAAAGVSASVGLVLGGILADVLSWRAGFFLNLPIGLGLILAAHRSVRETKRVSGVFDLAGAVVSTLGMGALVFAAIRSASAGWGDPGTLVALGGGLGGLMLFVAIERRAPQPIMPLRLFANRERSGANSVRILFLGACVGFFYFTSVFMQSGLKFSPTATGFAFLPSMLANFGTALMVPRLVRRLGARNVLAGSLMVTLVGMVMLTRITLETTYWAGLALPMLLLGFGQGGALGPLTMAGLAGVPSEDVGAASGLVNVAHQLGSSLGFSVMVAASAVGVGATGGAERLTRQVDHAMIAGAALLVLALILAYALIAPRAATSQA